MKVRTRAITSSPASKSYAFQIWGDHKWTIDRDKQRELAAFLNGKIATRR
jgi:hypothetical protein